MTSQTSPTITRRATRSGLPVLADYFQETWRFRTFAWHWSLADVKAKNFETFLGRLWHIINPLLFGLIYFIFVGIVSGRGLDSISLLAAIVGNLYAWLYFSSIVTSSIAAVQSGAGGVSGQSGIPKIVAPIASLLTATNLFLRSLIAYMIMHLIAQRGVHIEMLLAPVVMILIGMLGFGSALILATLNVYLRDVSRLIPHILRLVMYLSPVIWEYTRVLGDGSLNFLARLNPFFSGITAWTISLGGTLDPDGPKIFEQIGVFSIWAVVIFCAGILIFISKEDEFAIRN